MTSLRSKLRAVVWEMTDGNCEWPQCSYRAIELAHINPRGMGHTGYRDTLDNVMAACLLHARISDMQGGPDLLAREWAKVGDLSAGFSALRPDLTRRVRESRLAMGFDLDGMAVAL